MSDRSAGGTERFRKRAPGQPQDHPDWILSLSGGLDSTAAALVAIDALRTSGNDGNYAKKPLAIYLDTRVGVPLNRLYVEQLTDWLGVQLWTLRTDESFEEWIQDNGAPGPGKHDEVRDRLKRRQSSKLSTMADDPVMVLGISADESDARADLPKSRVRGRHREAYPVHRMPLKQRVEIILQSGCPLNPIWIMRKVIADCGCFANGDVSEADETIKKFPEFGQRLREYEEAIEHDGLKGTLGWGGLTAEEQRAREQGHTQETLASMCGVGGCQSQQDPAVIRAIRAKANGATADEAVAILYGTGPLDPELVAAADGGKPRQQDTDTERSAEAADE